MHKEQVDKSGLWVKLKDDPYGSVEDRFDALYYKDTRITLLDDDEACKLEDLAPHLVEDPDDDPDE